MTEEDIIRRIECEESFEYFARYFFKQLHAQKMLLNQHHKILFKVLTDVYMGKTKRLIINIPPGYSKTMTSVILFIAWSLAKNPQSRFLHLSYSDSLALENASTIRELVKSEQYQSMWQIKTRDDSDSVKKWWTTQRGGMYSTSAGGQVTGFRAGHMVKEFSGAVIIDDPLKPDDAGRKQMEVVNARYNNTIMSRLAHEDVPVIVIMQRVHANDLSGYLLRGGSGETWEHLQLPVYIDNKKYPNYYTHGKPIKHNLQKGWLWDYKHNENNKLALISHKRTYISQYMQRPEEFNIDAALFKQTIIDTYRLPKVSADVDITYIVVALDPSGDDGTGEHDEIGIVTCAIDSDFHYYILNDDSMNGSPKEWAEAAIKRYEASKANLIVYEKNYGGAMVENTLRNVAGGDFAALADVTATRGKMVRAEPISALYEQGRVHHVGRFYELENELISYDGSGKSPNRFDSLVWGITYLYEFCEMANLDDETVVMGR